jgi:prepilin-type N-terminal cleavage/methylation domain-containing protein
MYMKRPNYGFTVIELLIVIVVIGTIVAIGLIAWSGLLITSRDKARETDTIAWASSFDLYKGRYVVYPAMPTADGALGSVTLCLGAFTSTSSKCGQYGSATPTKFIAAAGSASLLTEMAKVGNVPSNSGAAINSALIGPLAYLTQSTAAGTVTVTGQFINFFEKSCPTGFTNINASLPTSIALVMTGLPAGTSANACSLSKVFSYTP